MVGLLMAPSLLLDTHALLWWGRVPLGGVNPGARLP
jgi:PIN domain nuclease of toxin-antitoxin system